MLIKKNLMTALVAIAAFGCGSVNTLAPASAQPASTPRAGAADAQTIKIVSAANAFLATLSEDQKKTVQFAFTNATQRANWSNFPEGIVRRAGLRWGELNAGQRAALNDLLAAVLSPYGVQMVHEQMDADESLKTNPGAGGGPGGGRGAGGPPGGGRGPGGPGGPGGRGGPPGGGRGPGGPGGGGGTNFGADNYFVAFLGAPSTTSPWMFQFGGHHLAINATIAGPNLSLSPSLTGGQPVRYEKDGKQINIVVRELTHAMTMVNGLTDAQRAKAVVSNQMIDLVLGPGHDGQVLQPEGLPASEMTEAQKTQLLALIEARIGIANAEDAAVAMAEIRRNLNQTYFAWYGPTTPGAAAYFRVTGPTLILEFSPQGMGGDPTQHLHNMYRNPANEYGSAWATLR